MTIEQRIAEGFGLDDRTWARHANPWSVWTRNTVLPLLVLALWSRVWLGWWSLLPGAAALLWTWLNPRLFSPPESTDTWASQAVLGERVWLRRNNVPVPAHHRWFPHILTSVAALGSLIVIAGVVMLHLWLTLLGAALVYAGKLWFLDRMVWLWHDVRDCRPEYDRWRSMDHH